MILIKEEAVISNCEKEKESWKIFVTVVVVLGSQSVIALVVCLLCSRKDKNKPAADNSLLTYIRKKRNYNIFEIAILTAITSLIDLLAILVFSMSLSSAVSKA